MNFLTALIDGLTGFVRRNPLFCLLLLLLALFAPSVLEGIAMFVVYAVLGLMLLFAAIVFSFRWKLYRMRRDMEKQFGSGTTAGGHTSRNREGEVKIRKTADAPEKRIRRDVGDYVDFEEMPDSDKNAQ
ncbi:MAG: DUF4834 family protein [Alistipes sp.]|nr:DUF4834 family protein [Alistipes sp.]